MEPSSGPKLSRKQLWSSYAKVLEKFQNELTPALLLVQSFCYPYLKPNMFSLEIRAMATHMRRAFAVLDQSCPSQKDFEAAREQINKADRHFTRCILDCQKWLCIYFEDAATDRVGKLDHELKLAFVNQGEYYEKIVTYQNEARKKLKEAKDSDYHGSEKKALANYQMATDLYDELYKLLYKPDDKTLACIERLKKEERSEKNKIRAKTVFGVVVALFGFALNFI